VTVIFLQNSEGYFIEFFGRDAIIKPVVYLLNYFSYYILFRTRPLKGNAQFFGIEGFEISRCFFYQRFGLAHVQILQAAK
jgi:hypothetical protein